MPYHVAKSGKCPTSKPWACIKYGTGEVMGCHTSKSDAEAQMAALYANEPAARTFNPDQPRGPDGKWVGTGWIHEVMHFAKGSADVGAGDDDHVTLDFNHGATHSHLSQNTADKFARKLLDTGKSDDLDVGHQTSFADYPKNGDPHALPIGYAGIKRTGQDEYQLELLHGDEHLTVTSAEAHALAKEIDRMASARRVETSQGAFTAVLEKNGRITTTWPATNGNPITLDMTVKQAEQVEQAISDLIHAIDEFPIDANGNPLLGPDDVVDTRTIRIGHTDLTIAAYGTYDHGGYFTFESSGHDWMLKLPDVEAELLEGSDGEGISGPIFGAVPINERADSSREVRTVSKTWTRAEQEQRGAIASHSTATVDTTWDGPGAEAAAPNDAAVLRYMHAWVDSSGDPAAKSSYKFPHHAPGTNTAANLNGVRNGLARLSNADIPDADRAGVERHLRRHLEDGTAHDHTKGSGVGSMREAAALRAQAHTSHRMLGTSAPAGAARSLAFPATEVRAQLVERDGRQFYRVEGYASVVDRGYEMWDLFGPYEEIVDARAFDKTLASSPDVAFLVNHRGLMMARTTNGSLELSMDGTGLRSVAYLNPNRQDVRDLASAIDDRLVTEMSFAFMLEDGEFSQDFSQFRIMQVDINRGDVSAVNYGANPYTSIAARSREIMADLDHLPPGAARAALGRLQQRLSDDDWALHDHHGHAAAEEPAVPQAVLKTIDGRGRSIAHIAALLEVD